MSLLLLMFAFLSLSRDTEDGAFGLFSVPPTAFSKGAVGPPASQPARLPLYQHQLSATVCRCLETTVNADGLAPDGLDCLNQCAPKFPITNLNKPFPS